jgi:hypothetical protein
VPAGLTNVVAIAASRGLPSEASHSLALRADGTVVAWGDNSTGQTTVPAGLTNVVAIAAGEAHNLALRADGTVVAWGSISHGQTTVPAGLANVVAIAAGTIHSLALRADGNVVGWGFVPGGPAPSNVVAIAAGTNHSLMLRADGRVVASAVVDNYGQATVPAGLRNAVAVAAGSFLSLAGAAASPTPTPTPTRTPTPTSTPLPTATPYPRPNVGVSVSTNPTTHTLHTTITARDANCTPNNQLESLRFTKLTNAIVEVATTPATTVTSVPPGGLSVPLPSRPPSVGLTVRRVGAGPTTVELVVTDGCGAWPTFVGGGAGAF